MKTFAEFEAARDANRDAYGRIVNQALDRRLQAGTRALAIELLGWAPETSPKAGDRYAATTSELVAWANERPRFSFGVRGDES